MKFKLSNQLRSECARATERASEARRAEQTSEQCERLSEQTSELLVINVPFSKGSQITVRNQGGKISSFLSLKKLSKLVKEGKIKFSSLKLS